MGVLADFPKKETFKLISEKSIDMKHVMKAVGRVEDPNTCKAYGYSRAPTVSGTKSPTLQSKREPSAR